MAHTDTRTTDTRQEGRVLRIEEDEEHGTLAVVARDGQPRGEAHATWERAEPGLRRGMRVWIDGDTARRI